MTSRPTLQSRRRIRQISPADADAFAAWHGAFTAGTLWGRELATVSTLQELIDSLSVPSPVKRRLAVGVFDEAACVGAMLFELPLQSDRETILVQIAVPPEHRRQGVATALWAWALERAETECRTVFQTEIHVPDGLTPQDVPGVRFAEERGFTCQNVEDHLVLELPAGAITRRSMRDGADGADDSDYDITVWIGACPDEHVGAWADLHTAMSGDVPIGRLTLDTVTYTVARIRTDEQRLAANWISLHAMARARSGEPVGYTTIYLPIGAPEHAYQDDTLVLHAHRGHNLGLRLKAANLDQMSALPEPDRACRRWLHTYTAEDNTAMQRVNARFGFRPIEKMCEFERRSSRG